MEEAAISNNRDVQNIPLGVHGMATANDADVGTEQHRITIDRPADIIDVPELLCQPEAQFGVLECSVVWRTCLSEILVNDRSRKRASRSGFRRRRRLNGMFFRF